MLEATKICFMSLMGSKTHAHLQRGSATAAGHTGTPRGRMPGRCLGMVILPPRANKHVAGRCGGGDFNTGGLLNLRNGTDLTE